VIRPLLLTATIFAACFSIACTSALPIIRGPQNLKQGELAIGGFINGGINNFDVGSATNRFLDFKGGISLYGGGLVEGGITDWFNPSIAAWYGLVDWGLLGQAHIQILKRPFPLTINGGYAFMRCYNSEYLPVNHIGFGSLIVGFPHDAYAGARLEKRFGSDDEVDPTSYGYERNSARIDYIPAIYAGWCARLFKSLRLNPHAEVTYNTNTRFWQLYLGISAHYIVIRK
jgi:hypothetical protein